MNEKFIELSSNFQKNIVNMDDDDDDDDCKGLFVSFCYRRTVIDVCVKYS